MEFKINPNDKPAEFTLIREELCRVIANAERLQTCVCAWDALMSLRRMEDAMEAERRHLRTAPCSKAGGAS